MPWCEECSKYWTPNSMNEDGTCPACGRVVEEPGEATSAEAAAVDEKAPWHFKLLVASMAVYLVWRAISIFT